MSGDAVIRIAIVDDQTLVRQGIRGLIELDPGMKVVVEASDGSEAMRLVPPARPDVILLDVRMPRMSGIEVLRSLGARGELRPTLLLTTFDDEDILLEGIAAGARGFLLKDVSLEELNSAIRAIASGQTVLKPAVTDRVHRGFDRSVRAHATQAPPVPPEPLTDREREILRLLAGGFSNREIAQALSVAEGTVKNHVSHLLTKLGVRDRTRAVLKGLETGLI